MWASRKTLLSNERVVKFAIDKASAPVSYADVIQLWQNDAGFRTFFTAPLLDYGHFAAFLKHSPEAQQHSLWKVVAAAMQRRLGSKPVWLSSAGGGVDWLHIRLDDSPKYYGYRPYRNAAW